MSSQSPELGNELAEPAASGRRGWIAAALAAAVLLAVCAAKWIGFVYPNYLGAVIFQCGALALFLIWAWPRRLPVGSWRALRPAACLFCAYAAFSVASSLWAPESRLAAIGSLPMFFGVTWALGLGHLLSGRRHIRLILRAMFAAGTLAALVGLLYVLLSGQDKWTRAGSQPQGLLPNALAEGLSAGGGGRPPGLSRDVPPAAARDGTGRSPDAAHHPAGAARRGAGTAGRGAVAVPSADAGRIRALPGVGRAARAGSRAGVRLRRAAFVPREMGSAGRLRRTGRCGVHLPEPGCRACTRD